MLFPATTELLHFLYAFILLGSCAWYIRRFDPIGLRRLYKALTHPKNAPSFPRQFVDKGVKTLPPMRKVTPRYLAYRLKFTLCMFFVNVYTYVFTNDFHGKISKEVLQGLGFSYQNFMQHKWFILITSNFIHFHLLHLAANMLMLLAFSGSLELLAGTGMAASVYLVSMNSNVPNGLFLLPGLRVFFPDIWKETVQFLDVGASLGIIGSLGGLARLLKPWARWPILATTVTISVGAAVVQHELIGVDHAFSALLGYIVASYCLRRAETRAGLKDNRIPFPVEEMRAKRSGTHGF